MSAEIIEMQRPEFAVGDIVKLLDGRVGTVRRRHLGMCGVTGYEVQLERGEGCVHKKPGHLRNPLAGDNGLPCDVAAPDRGPPSPHAGLEARGPGETP